MEELKVDYKFDLEDFKNMEDIEHVYFENGNIAPAEECLKWYNKNNMTCVGVRNKDDKVMADASTIHGEKICNKLLKMKFITDTSHKSKIYCEDGEKFIEVINKFKRKNKRIKYVI